MRDRDYVWCLTHMALDQEEERCPVCGAPAGTVSGGHNASFDQDRYERLKKGERV